MTMLDAYIALVAHVYELSLCTSHIVARRELNARAARLTRLGLDRYGLELLGTYSMCACLLCTRLLCTRLLCAGMAGATG